MKKSKKSFRFFLFSLVQNALQKTLVPVAPLHLLRTVAGPNLLIPYYHIVSDIDDIAHVKHLFTYRSITQFMEDLDFFLKFYAPITLGDLLEFLKKEVPLPKNSFLLTFDDGFREVYDVVAPILKEKGLSATFFLCKNLIDNNNLGYRQKASVLIEKLQSSSMEIRTSEIEKIFAENNILFTDFKTNILSLNYHQHKILDRIAAVLDLDFSEYLSKVKPYLSFRQVQDLISDGFTVGAHSIDHPLYSRISIDNQIYQTTESIEFIYNSFDLDYRAFAFPYSDHGVREEYFHKVSRIQDISFGTSGLMDDRQPNSFQRVWMENSTESAEKIISRHYVSKIFRTAIGKNVISRD